MSYDYESPNSLIKKIEGIGLYWEFEDWQGTRLVGRKSTSDGLLVVKMDHSTGYWTDRALIRRPQIQVFAYLETSGKEHTSLFFHNYEYEEKEWRRGEQQQGYADYHAMKEYWDKVSDEAVRNKEQKQEAEAAKRDKLTDKYFK
jgi:hypothetical protein